MEILRKIARSYETSAALVANFTKLDKKKKTVFRKNHLLIGLFMLRPRLYDQGKCFRCGHVGHQTDPATMLTARHRINGFDGELN